MVLLLAGCGNWKSDGGREETGDTQMDLLEGTRGIFLILEHNTLAETLKLYSYENGAEYYYHYDFATGFYDKYGNNEPKERFAQGRVVELDAKNTAGMLTGVHLSDEVWEQKNIVRFSVNEEEGILNIGGENYSIRSKVAVFSQGKEITLSDLWEEDRITVVGQGRNVLSIDVERGHGTLRLVNTALFDGSLMNLGDRILEKISEGLSIKVAEGTYELTVAKDGWGSTTEVTIRRGELTEIDLETIKGEGPKKGTVTFQVNVEDAKVYIDHRLVDHTKPLELTYGTHVLEISANGYTGWRKKLLVQSEEATIIVELEKEQETEKEPDESEKETENKKEESQNSNTRMYGNASTETPEKCGFLP